MIETAGQGSNASAILVLDIDHTVTRAVLCDVVEGSARLVDVSEASTTSGPPFHEMSIGIARAVRLLEDQTGRRLMEGEAFIAPSRPDGDGVDRVFVTGLPAEPNRIGLLSLENGAVSNVIRGAIRRTASVLSEASEFFAWTQSSMSPSAIDQWVRDSRPSTLVLIAGNGPPDDWRAALESIASSAPGYGAAQGIIIADEERQQIAAEVLDDTLELSGIDPAVYQSAEISSAVEAELRDQYASRLPEEPALQAFSSGLFVDRVQGIESVAAFLHRRMGRRLAVLSVQAGTLLEIASDQGSFSVYRGDLDIDASARSLLQLPPSQIARWAPSQMTDDEVRHWLLNRSLRPHVKVFGSGDRSIAGGAIRESVLLATQRAGADEPLDIDLAILGRELIDTCGAGALLVALDSLRALPADGVLMMSVDRDGIIAALGAISAGEPDYAREVIENDFLAPLGSCIIFTGSAQPGSRIADIEVVIDEGERVEVGLSFGELRTIPLPEGRSAQVTVTPKTGIAVGRYAEGEAVTYSDDRVVHGGQFGIILDGRGRPSELPADHEARINTLNRWQTALTGESD
jgi:hypothetical protein